MEKDSYERFIEDVKRHRPQIRDEEKFRKDLLLKLNAGNRSNTRPLIFVLRVAASVALLVSLGSYVWLEAYTREKRWLAEQELNAGRLTDGVDWQCYQAVDELLALLIDTESLTTNGRSVAINKSKLQHLKSENKKLFAQLEGLLAYMKQFYPADYEALQSGETIRLNAWKLRKEYGVCHWITNN